MVPITVMVFDKAERTETPIIRDAVPAGRWNEIETAEAAPRGYTPLLDVHEPKLTALVEQRNPDKAVITIITDGEDASTEVTLEGARAALERLKSKGHQVVFSVPISPRSSRRAAWASARPRCRWRAAASPWLSTPSPGGQKPLQPPARLSIHSRTRSAERRNRISAVVAH